jgi:glutamate racemase
MTSSTSPIGVFDSGIGGLSILKALRAHLPHEQFVYYADTKHNPYGEKGDAFVQERTLAVAQELIERQGVKALVVACNTATAAAIHLLREAHPELPIVGVEPALRPAALITRTGKVAVFATRGTLQSAKFAALRTSLAHVEFVCTPCDGLAEQIERLSEANGDWQITINLIANYVYQAGGEGLFSSKKSDLDTWVLGCTHYPLIREEFAKLAGAGVTIVDNALPVAQRAAQLLRERGALNEQGAGQLGEPPAVVWQSSADVAALRQAARYWLGDNSQ